MKTFFETHNGELIRLSSIAFLSTSAKKICFKNGKEIYLDKTDIDHLKEVLLGE